MWSLLLSYCVMHNCGIQLPYVVKYWWAKILANLANRSHVAKINPSKILPLHTEFIAPVIIIANVAGLFVVNVNNNYQYCLIRKVV